MSHILDISRFVSRAHLPFDTGIDRVERAFVLDTLNRFKNPHFIAQVGNKFAILDAKGMQYFLKFKHDQNWPRQSGIDVMRLKLTVSQRRVRSTLRSLSIEYCQLYQLAKKIKDTDIGSFDYTNVGHTNLSDAFLQIIRYAGARNVSAFIHDLIPLDYPQYCRSDRLKPFAQNMQNIIEHCDQIYCNSHYTADRIAARFDNTPPVRVAYLASPKIEQKIGSAYKKFDKPTFAMLGTIEPRKNLTFILDVWDLLEAILPNDEMPALLIMGKRGWEDAAVFKRLDSSAYVIEKNALSDDEVQNHLMGCQALLFPSHVEGYGLPAQEAIALGVPVLASDIPVFFELFGKIAILLPIDDPKVWADYIRELLVSPKKIHTSMNYCSKIAAWDNFFDEIYTNSARE